MNFKGNVLLSDVVKPDVVRVGVQARTREEAIKAAGRILVECGIAEERYIAAMLSVCDQLGPYIVLVPGVAIPHAAPEDGALGVGLAVAVLAAPVSFGHPDNDPVHTVIAFASSDQTRHMGVLSALARFLGDPGRCERMAHARCAQDVIDLLNGGG
jgi:mannitol/fructose-specific phosphotransferase system IIA component (Ntr-type)